MVGERRGLGEDLHEQHVLVELLQLFVPGEHCGHVELRDAGPLDDDKMVFDEPLRVDVPQPISERLALLVEDQVNSLRVGALVLRQVGFYLDLVLARHDVDLTDLRAVHSPQDVVQNAGARDFLQTLGVSTDLRSACSARKT